MKPLFALAIFFSMPLAAQNLPGLNISLDSLFTGYFKPGEPGGAVLIAKNDKLIYSKGFGIADIGTKEPISTKTLFNLGSISKTFVAYGILFLEQEGKLSTNDPVSRFFSFRHPEVIKDIRLYHLLTHTSGLPDSRKVKEEHDFYLTARDEENWAPILETDSLEFSPGTDYKYSNPAFNGLALIIEKTTGRKWQDFIREKIFLPSGMRTSTITDGPHPDSGVAHGYVFSEERGFEELDYGEEPTFAAAGNGGVWSSVEELWKYELAIQNQVFLEKKMLEKSRTIQKFAGSWDHSLPPRLGLSWFINDDSLGRMIGHTGSQGGFTSDYCWWPEQGLFYVLLTNIPRPVGEIRQKLLPLLATLR